MKELKNNPGNELAKVLWYYNLIPDFNINNQKIICPFHKDVNPSLIVNLDEGNWFCFGCNKSGDSKTFVKLMEKDLNDLESLKKHYKILKSNKCSNIKISPSTKQRKVSGIDLYNIAYDYYYGLKKVNWLNPEGSDVYDNLIYMLNRGFTQEVLNKCEAKITYNNSYPIIFPMLDNKEFKGWVCRTTNKEIEAKRKYLYNKGFSRATTLVGNYKNRNVVILVEGYMDRLKFLQFGIKNAVAILGWKITSEQIEKLKKAGIKNIISALDNDDCGKKGTQYLKNYFNVIRWKYLKGIKDPGEMTEELFFKMYNKTIQIYKEEIKNGIN